MEGNTDDSQYMVTGLVINTGRPPSIEPIDQIIETLRHDVPSFAELAPGISEVSEMGEGSGDFLLLFAINHQPTIQETWEAIHALALHPLVADIDPAVEIRSNIDEDGDKHLPTSNVLDWSLRSVRLPAALAKHDVTGKGVRIGHPDTGYTDHPEIIGPRLLTTEGWDFEDRDPKAEDPLKKGVGHGTATASVIFANTKNIPRVNGIAPDATLVPLRVSNVVVHFNFANLVEALDRAREKNCHIVSMSLGGPWAGRALGRAVDRAVESGMILLAAAGNVWPWVVYPARFDSVVAVAASNSADKPWRRSASGETVDITAPGESVWRAVSYPGPPRRYAVERSSGTSYAVATTAGVCALWMEHWGVSNLRARYGSQLSTVFLHLLKQSYRPIEGWKTKAYGPGILDAEKLLDLPLPLHAPAALWVSSPPPGRMRSFEAVDRLQHYFPELSSQQLAKAATAILGDPGKAVSALRNETVAHPTLLDEVEFYVATSPAVRDEFVRAARGKRSPPATSMEKGVTNREADALNQLASPLLKRVLQDREQRILKSTRPPKD